MTRTPSGTRYSPMRVPSESRARYCRAPRVSTRKRSIHTPPSLVPISFDAIGILTGTKRASCSAATLDLSRGVRAEASAFRRASATVAALNGWVATARADSAMCSAPPPLEPTGLTVE